MKSPPTPVFRPRDGALLDLDSLLALASGPDRHLHAWMAGLWPGASALVISGLEPSGEWSTAGPPGTRRPDAAAAGIAVSPGLCVLTDKSGASVVVRVEEELFAPWPTAAGSGVRGVLVLVPRVEPMSLEGDLVVARDQVSVELGFVRPDQAEQPHLLPLAASVGNGRDWATDLRRLWQPEHPTIRLLLKRFEQLEHTVWKAEPEGSVWERQVLGRNWVRYQTIAATALTSSRMILESKATTTLERVRMLAALRRQLQGSVERAATDLLQLIGPAEGAGPYQAVLDDGGGS